MINRKFATISLSLALVLGVAAPAGAQTVAELQAQINALMAQLASLQGGAAATAGTSFTQDLTVGSTGAQVTALQQMLVAQGHLVMPAGAAYGYFGNLTKTAVAKWQGASGVSPAAGYFGPVSRAKANSMVGTVPGTTVGTTTTGGTVTTPGVEGTITARLASTPTGVKVYEGDSKKAVMGVELEAKLSDIKVERIKLDLGNSTNLYRKIASKLYVMNGSTVLASVDLNSNTVVKEGSNYYITVAGLNFVVPKDTKRNLNVAIDAMGTWDTPFNTTWSITVPVDGVRGVDGAGVNQYSPATGASFSRNFTTEDELISDASLKVSLNSDTPKVADVIAADGADEDEKDGVELVRFDVRAEKDSVAITDLIAAITRSGSGAATTTTVYLMDGNTVLDSVNGTTLPAIGGNVTFDDIDYVVGKDSTKTLRIVVDIADANSTAVVYSASVSSGANITAENSAGDTLADGVKTGSATGENQTVRNVGLEVSLVSKSITKGSTPSTNNTATSTAEATFVLRVKAVGGDIRIGEQASTSGAFVGNIGNDGTNDDPSFRIFQGGSDVTASIAVSASTTGYTVPTTGTTASGTYTRLLAEGATIEFPVSFLFTGRTAGGVFIGTGSYAVQLAKINFVSSGGLQHSTFMANSLDWRTSTVSMP